MSDLSSVYRRVKGGYQLDYFRTLRSGEYLDLKERKELA
jgi:hypothetical protein